MTIFTPNYKLDLYEDADAPNLRDQYNAAMGKIDTQLKALADAAPEIDVSGLAPKVHVSRQGNTYGQASNISYGHVLLSDAAATAYDTTYGIAATPKAVAAMAPKSHASADTTYGAAGKSLYGHVKLTDTVSSNANSNAANGIAVTPKGVVDYVAANAGGAGTWESGSSHALSGMTSAGITTIEGAVKLHYNDTLKLGLLDVQILHFVSTSSSSPGLGIGVNIERDCKFYLYQTIFQNNATFCRAAITTSGLTIFANGALNFYNANQIIMFPLY